MVGIELEDGARTVFNAFAALSLLLCMTALLCVRSHWTTDIVDSAWWMVGRIPMMHRPV